MSKHNALLGKLRHHVTGAIERGEKCAIEAQLPRTVGTAEQVIDLLESLEALLSELDQNGCHHYMNEASSYADSYNDIIKRCRLAVAKAKEQL